MASLVKKYDYLENMTLFCRFAVSYCCCPLGFRSPPKGKSKDCLTPLSLSHSSHNDGYKKFSRVVLRA